MIGMEEDRNKILEQQKNMIAAILDYQIKYGTSSISGWNVAVNFNLKEV